MEDGWVVVAHRSAMYLVLIYFSVFLGWTGFYLFIKSNMGLAAGKQGNILSLAAV